jgi:hypothetical protein
MIVNPFARPDSRSVSSIQNHLAPLRTAAYAATGALRLRLDPAQLALSWARLRSRLEHHPQQRSMRAHVKDKPVIAVIDRELAVAEPQAPGRPGVVGF